MVSKFGQFWRWHSRILEEEESPILLDVGVFVIEKFFFPINRCGVEDVVAAREAEELEGCCQSRILLSHSFFSNSVFAGFFSVLPPSVDNIDESAGDDTMCGNTGPGVKVSRTASVTTESSGGTPPEKIRGSNTLRSDESAPRAAHTP